MKSILSRPTLGRHRPPHLGILVLGTVLILASPVTAFAQSDSDQIKQALVEMWDAIEQGDVARYATYVHDDFTSFGETDTYLRSGKRLEVAGVESWTTRYNGIKTEMHQPEVIVRGDTAWITYYWTDESFSSDTGERGTTRGKSTRIFVREGGRWLCIHGHYTLVE